MKVWCVFLLKFWWKWKFNLGSSWFISYLCYKTCVSHPVNLGVSLWFIYSSLLWLSFFVCLFSFFSEQNLSLCISLKKGEKIIHFLLWFCLNCAGVCQNPLSLLCLDSPRQEFGWKLLFKSDPVWAERHFWKAVLPKYTKCLFLVCFFFSVCVEGDKLEEVFQQGLVLTLYRQKSLSKMCPEIKFSLYCFEGLP